MVGRLAAQLSLLLQVSVVWCVCTPARLQSLTRQPHTQGKDKPHWSPWGDVGDVVVVKNTAHVDFTGKKWTNKLYRWHTGWAVALMPCSVQRQQCHTALCHRYPGGLKQRSARSQHGMDPTSVLWKAVNGMLPKNKLRQVGRHASGMSHAMAASWLSW